MGWGLKKFVKTLKKHHEEITKASINPKRLWEHVRDPKEGMKTHIRHFKEFTSTTTGKVAFAVIAWFVGGSVFGGSGSSTGTAVAETGATNVGTSALTEGAGVVAAEAAPSIVSSAAAATPTVAAQGAGGFWGGVVDAAQGFGGYVTSNPELAATVLGGVASASAPDEIDMLEERQKQIDKERQNRNDRLSQEVDLSGITGSNQAPLRDNYGNRVYNNRGGIIDPAVSRPRDERLQQKDLEY